MSRALYPRIYASLGFLGELEFLEYRLSILLLWHSELNLDLLTYWHLHCGWMGRAKYPTHGILLFTGSFLRQQNWRSTARIAIG